MSRPDQPPGAEPSPQLQSGVAEAAEDRAGTPAERGDRNLSGPLGLAAIAVYAAVGATAALTLPAAFLAVLLLTQVVDLLVLRDGYVRAVLARGQFGIATRSTVRELATVVLVLGEPWASRDTRHAAAVCVLAVPALRLLYQLLLVPVRRRAAVPVETRNVDLTGLRLPALPHPLLLTRVSERTTG